MKNISRGDKNQRTMKRRPVPYPLGHGFTTATIFELVQIKLNTEPYTISCKLYWKPHTAEKHAQMTKLIQIATYPTLLIIFLF